MNLLWDISEKKYDSAAIYTREAAERHRRLRTPERRQIVAPVVKAVVVALRDEQPEPQRARCKLPKDAHVLDYYAFFAGRRPQPCREYIARRAEELGVAYNDIMSPSRFKKVVRARQLLMWEIKRIQKPDVSYPELGRIFGGKDHTTVIHAVQKMDREMQARAA